MTDSEEKEYGTMFTLKGHKIDGLLEKRLLEPGYSRINQLPGLLVHTSRGLFYSELYLPGHDEPVPREGFTELTHGFTEYFTKLMAEHGDVAFSIQRTPRDRA
jgi:hypothetical protein